MAASKYNYYDKDKVAGAQQGGMHYPISHHGNAAEYQASGFPFVYHHGADMDDQRIEFPFVTQWILVSAPSADAHIAFRSSQADVAAGTVSNKFVIPQNSAIILPIRCIDLWVDSAAQTDVSVMAGLTGVPRSQFPSIIGLEGIATVETATGTAAAATVTPG